jgi:hypothetical protein
MNSNLMLYHSETNNLTMRAGQSKGLLVCCTKPSAFDAWSGVWQSDMTSSLWYRARHGEPSILSTLCILECIKLHANNVCLWVFCSCWIPNAADWNLEPKLAVSFIPRRPLSPDYDPLCYAVSAAGSSVVLITTVAQVPVVQQWFIVRA